MHPDDWHVTEDADTFLARAGAFLRSRPALHTMHLTVSEKLRGRGHKSGRGHGAGAAGAEAPVFGWLEQAGDVRAAFYRAPGGLPTLTPLTAEQADALAARLAGTGRPLPGVRGDGASAGAFAAAWRRRTGATPALQDSRVLLYRLEALTPPLSRPEGRSRVAGEADRDRIVAWCREFAAAVKNAAEERASANAASWAGTRFAEKHFSFWQTPDGTPVAMAGRSPMTAGQIRVDPVYTPARFRGRGYAGAVTADVSRAALDAGAAEVLLFADAANPTSNALYQRIGYAPVTEFVVYDFTGGARGGGPGLRGR